MAIVSDTAKSRASQRETQASISDPRARSLVRNFTRICLLLELDQHVDLDRDGYDEQHDDQVLLLIPLADNYDRHL